MSSKKWGFGAPKAAAAPAVTKDYILSRRKTKLLKLSRRQVVYILNKINWRLVNILCDLDTDSLSDCIGKINTYFLTLQTPGGGKAFDINLATIMGASEGKSKISQEFLGIFFLTENGTHMTEAQRLAYFASEWPRGDPDDAKFELFISALGAQKKTRDDAIAAKIAGKKSAAASTGGKATLRVGLQPANASELGYIHIFGHGRDEVDIINIHCTYEGYSDATGIHFTDNLFSDDVKHMYCNLLGYLLTTNSSKLSTKSNEVKKAGERYRDRFNRKITTYLPPPILSKLAEDALCSTVPKDAICAYRQLKSTTGIPIPKCGTNILEGRGPLGIAAKKGSGAVGGISPNAVAVTAAGAGAGPAANAVGGTGPEAGSMAVLSLANIAAGAGPALPLTELQQQQVRAEEYIPMSQRVNLPSPPGFPPGYAPGPPPGYAPGPPLGYYPPPGFPPGPPPGFPPGSPPGFAPGFATGPQPGFATGPPPVYAPQSAMAFGAAGGVTSQQMMYYPPPPPRLRFPVVNSRTGQIVAYEYTFNPVNPPFFLDTRYAPMYGGKRKTLRRKKSKQKSKQTKHRRRSKQ